MICTTAKCIFPILLLLNPFGVDSEQAFCMAMNIYHEARGEVLEGQVQVAHVTLSRVTDPRFPSTVCDVVKKKGAFTWVLNNPTDDINFKRPDGTVNQAEISSFIVATELSIWALNGYLPDRCDGANHYYNPSLATPNWSKIYTHKCVIDDHVFLKREVGSAK